MSATTVQPAQETDQAQELRQRRARNVQRFLRHPSFVLGVLVLLLMVVVALLAPWIAPYSPTKTDMVNTLAPASWQHWLGTDQFGRDVLSRILYGTRVSLQVALSVVVLSLAIGTLFGAIAGYAGGWVDRAMVMVNDILMAFPGFLLALAIVAARGSSLDSVILAVAIAYSPRIAAVMRAVALTIRPRPFIEASRSIGMTPVRILLRHVVPNALPPVIVVGTVSAASAILAEAGLSFLGLGVTPPTPTWGSIISDGQAVITTRPLISISAGLCIAIAVVALNLLGDGLRDVLDPQMRRETATRML